MGRRLITIIFSVLLIANCGGGSGGSNPDTIAQKGNRILSIDVTVAGDADYDGAFTTATSAGMQVTSLPLNWGDLETAPGIYDNTLLAIADAYYPPKGVAISLSLRTINTNQKEVPADLANTNFDDPVMISRFKQFLDFVFTQIPNLTLNSLSIGNEIDAYLGTDTTKWTQYRTFYDAVSTYARTKRTNLKVGTKSTFAGISNIARTELAALNNSSDVVMVTYYPLNTDFTVKDLVVIANDFQTLVNLYPGKPVYLMELGYPSGTLCNSSDSKQSEFISKVFETWDTYRDEIPMISFTWLNDLSPQAVQDLTTYYGINDPIFSEYLATLGLRTHAGPGSDKPAFTTFKEQANKRGW